MSLRGLVVLDVTRGCDVLGYELVELMDKWEGKAAESDWRSRV